MTKNANATTIAEITKNQAILIPQSQSFIRALRRPAEDLKIGASPGIEPDRVGSEENPNHPERCGSRRSVCLSLVVIAFQKTKRSLNHPVTKQKPCRRWDRVACAKSSERHRAPKNTQHVSRARFTGAHQGRAGQPERASARHRTRAPFTIRNSERLERARVSAAAEPLSL